MAKVRSLCEIFFVKSLALLSRTKSKLRDLWSLTDLCNQYFCAYQGTLLPDLVIFIPSLTFDLPYHFILLWWSGLLTESGYSSLGQVSKASKIFWSYIDKSNHESNRQNSAEDPLQASMRMISTGKNNISCKIEETI